MDTLDIVLVVICLGFAFSGYRQGFVVGFLSFVGFIGGGALGAKYASSLHGDIRIGLGPAMFGLLAVVICAMLGQLVATLIGVAIRREFTWRPLRTLDSVAGGAVSVISVLLVAWLVGASLAQSASGGVSREVRHSSILKGVDQVMPDAAHTWFASFRRLLDRDGLPEVFGGIGNEPITKVAPPSKRLVHSAVVRRAEPDVVKVTGIAESCSRQLEGSGFVYAVDRVLTNAHVVAGIASPTVQTVDGRTLPAHVVVFDPERDVAVLLVPNLDLTPLAFGGALSSGDSAIVAGYPENGGFTPRAARIRNVQNARGPDIYQNREVTRQIYALYAKVQPGNSGGPLLSTSGQVAGMVFAAAIDDPKTGYALTAHEITPDANTGATATREVSTQGCD
ncbi:MAG TPA: MarP family serine protease [Mycobacteriales bacterium]|jgi:S1-C subfamily serine protease|nr:MarP family serine protease [Mycobacteriales bacterium]